MNMEIGSFIELQLPQNREYYQDVPENEIIRLNSGRAAIYHAMRVYGLKKVYLPYYECDSVRDFLLQKGIKVKYYFLNSNFEPLIEQEKNTAVLIVNYYGMMSLGRMEKLAQRFAHVILDNAQAFYSKPIAGCLNVYSARKFIGTPNGAYVIGKNVKRYGEGYHQDFSSDRALFLLQRIEYGCEGKAYKSREISERSLDSADPKRMAGLSFALIDAADNDVIISKRRENFKIANLFFRQLNRLNVELYMDENVVPMIYPLVIENDGLLDELLKHKHFQGHWWSYLLGEVPGNSLEYYLSRYMIPITIDQRYGVVEIQHIYEIITNFLYKDND